MAFVKILEASTFIFDGPLSRYDQRRIGTSWKSWTNWKSPYDKNRVEIYIKNINLSIKRNWLTYIHRAKNTKCIITVGIFGKSVPRANLICTLRGKVFLSILTSRRCRSHLKLRTLFILLNDASERNINIIGKTCKSPGTINAEGNHRRSLEQSGSREGKRRNRPRCTRQVFTKLPTCRVETTGSRFVVLEKFFIEISVVVNHAAIYVLPTAKHYWANNEEPVSYPRKMSHAENIPFGIDPWRKYVKLMIDIEREC